MRNVNHLRGGRPLAKFVSSQVYETCTRVLRYIYIYIWLKRHLWMELPWKWFSRDNRSSVIMATSGNCVKENKEIQAILISSNRANSIRFIKSHVSLLSRYYIVKIYTKSNQIAIKKNKEKLTSKTNIVSRIPTIILRKILQKLDIFHETQRFKISHVIS